MSRKKIWKTVGLDPEIAKRLTEEAEVEQRGMGFIVEQELRKRYAIPRVIEKEKSDAN
jgi:predicted transcriptional regulator